MNNQMYDIKYPILSPVPIEFKSRNILKMILVWLFNIRKWRIVLNCFCEVESWNNMIVKIPEGFIFDGASIPRFLWWFMSPVGFLFGPGLIHDFGYRHGYLLTADGSKKDMTKSELDKLFRDIAIEETGLIILPWIAYIGLVLFGFIGWYSNTNRRTRKQS